MKKYQLFFFASIFIFSCSEQRNASTANLEGDIIWHDGDISIENVNDSIPKVVIKGLKRESQYQLSYSILDENETEMVLSGRISILGDLNNNGVPEFLHEDVTETADTVFGWRNLLRITPNKKISVISGASTSIDKKHCQQPIGFEEYFTIDSTNRETQFIVLNGKYGYLSNSFQQATSKIYFSLQANQSYLTRVYNCPINNPEIELDILYEQNNYELRSLQNLYHNYYSLYDYYNKFRACGDDGRNGVSHLEALAYTIFKNGNNAKRNDLMPFIEDEFININPAFITWIKDNLIPNPTDSQANGLTYSFMYQYGYKQQFRKFALLKLLIMQQGQEQLMKEYAIATSTIDYIEKEERIVHKDNFNTYGFLEEKRNWIITNFIDSGYETNYLENTDYGFLMRRMLDGSEPAIWSTMQKVLKLYDNEWYEQTFVDRKYTGVLHIDSATYYQNRSLSGVDSLILGKEAIPDGIAVVNGAGITITCKNGKEVTFINNNGDGEAYASYNLTGYWPQKEIVQVDYTGWEWGNTILVNLTNGTSNHRNYHLIPSKNGQFLAEKLEEMEYSAIQLFMLEGSEWKKLTEFAQQSYSDGFWFEDVFYFKEGKNFFMIGELIIDGIALNQESDTQSIEEPATTPIDSLSL